uniref:Uncharacterized protein n=1 Tax=Strombidium inclinatum TaxID=197538 RepID=A0A7S3INT4_9SPIT
MDMIKWYYSAPLDASWGDIDADGLWSYTFDDPYILPSSVLGWVLRDATFWLSVWNPIWQWFNVWVPLILLIVGNYIDPNYLDEETGDVNFGLYEQVFGMTMGPFGLFRYYNLFDRWGMVWMFLDWMWVCLLVIASPIQMIINFVQGDIDLYESFMAQYE